MNDAAIHLLRACYLHVPGAGRIRLPGMAPDTVVNCAQRLRVYRHAIIDTQHTWREAAGKARTVQRDESPSAVPDCVAPDCSSDLFPRHVAEAKRYARSRAAASTAPPKNRHNSAHLRHS
jgi:hypothetical protein